MAQSRGLAIFGFLSSVLIAIVASFILSDTKSSSRTLYCVYPTSSYFITTLNTSAPHAKCFRVENGIFAEILTEVPKEKEGITWLDGYVLPGIIDSHGHILQYGEMLESVSLYDSKSVEEMRERIKAFLKEHRGQGYGTRDKWIRGVGWDQKFFGGVMPTAVSYLIRRNCPEY
jgi:predicted amidohydrolase YtcJ